jgi:hypothetical protein
VNAWRLQTWLGHKRIDETMLYVHVAENHRREIPESIPLRPGDPAPIAGFFRCSVHVAAATTIRAENSKFK